MSDTAVLILSCDKYKDAWKPFFSLFNKFWPSCPYPVYLGINEIPFETENVKIIRSGKAKDWSADTRKILEQIPETFVIVLLEDYFLQRPVDNDWLQKCLDFTKKNDAGFMRIASFREDHTAMYAYDVSTFNPAFGITRLNASFRVNLQAGIWNRNDLLALIKDGESPWEFEINGSVRSRSMKKPFLGITQSSHKNVLVGPIPYLCTAITKGVWMREVLTLCKKEQIEIDLTKRPLESRIQYLKRKIYHGFSYPNRKYIDFIAGKFR
ncbi:MAG: hypothetical protein M3R17_12680 [Bacteroidota bacterium]|nr:hypothetical protein [Bacteroidota bacterium]